MAIALESKRAAALGCSGAEKGKGRTGVGERGRRLLTNAGHLGSSEQLALARPVNGQWAMVASHRQRGEKMAAKYTRKWGGGMQKRERDRRQLKSAKGPRGSCVLVLAGLEAGPRRPITAQRSLPTALCTPKASCSALSPPKIAVCACWMQPV